MRWQHWTTGVWISEPHGLSSNLNPCLQHQVLHLPSSCLGGVCCQWDRSGVFAGLYLVWTFLAPPLIIILLPVAWVPRSPRLLVGLPRVPKMHVVTVTLACVNVALSLESRACE